MLGPIGLDIIRRSAGVPLICGLILSNQWGPPHLAGSSKIVRFSESQYAIPDSVNIRLRTAAYY